MACRYLVTGGAGFIGSNLILALAKKGEKVRALDNLSTGFWENLEGLDGVERVTGDIRDARVVADAMRGIEVVFHHAALGSVPLSIENPVESDAVNSGGTVTVLDQARAAGVRRVLFAASSAAYGDNEALPKREDMPTAPLSPYAVTKLAAESYLKVFASLYGVETLNFRYFNIFGPNQRPDGAYAAAIPRFLWAALRDEELTIFGDGETTRDFCYVDNVVEANLAAAATPTKLNGQIVNIAGGRRISLNDLVSEIEKTLGKELRVKHGPPRAGDVRHSLADISRAEELLGWKPRVRWEDGIGPTAAFLRRLNEARQSL